MVSLPKAGGPGPSYLKKEMVYDCKDEVMVFDVNLKNAYMHDKVLKRIHAEYPMFFKEFESALIRKKVSIGSVFVRKYDGDTLCALVTSESFSDTSDEANEAVKKFTEIALDDLVRVFGKDKKFISGMIGASFNQGRWSVVHNYVRKHELKWDVYRD